VSEPLHHSALGPEGRPPIVLLHGFAGDHETWTNIQTALAPRRRSLAFDLPGHGGERGRAAGNARVLAEAVSASLDGLGVERAHLVGHSLGGAVASLVALESPGRAASLTLLAPGGFGAEINARLLRRFARATQEAELAAVIEELYGFETEVPRHLARRLAEQRRDPAVLEPLGAIAEAILEGTRQRVLPLDRLGELPCPVKVLWGTQDRMVPTRQCHRLPGVVATHVFPGVGHMVHLEAPHETARLILENAAGE